MISGASATLTQGSTVTGPCTTDVHGRCCNPCTSGAFSVAVSATGYESATVTGTAVCPPPPSPVAYGLNFPATWADDATIGTGVWSNPGNAGASDSVYATAPSTGNVPTHYLKGTNPGFAIPTDGTEAITGVVVEVRCKADHAATDYDCRLVVGGVIQATNLATGTNLSTGVPVLQGYGSSANMWGLGLGGLTPAQANATDFGFVWSAKSPGGGGGTPSLVQAPTATTNSSNTASGTFAATTAGNFLVATISVNAGTITTPTGWAAGPSKTGGAGTTVAIFTRSNAPSTTTVSASLSTSTRWVVMLAEYSGMGSAPTADGTATGTSNSGAVTTTGADLVLAGLAGISGTFSAPGGGFTLQTQGSLSGISAAFLWRTAAAGTYTASASGVTVAEGVACAFTAGGGPTTISVDYGVMIVYTTRNTYEINVFLATCTAMESATQPQPATLQLTSVLGTITLNYGGGGGFGTYFWQGLQTLPGVTGPCPGSFGPPTVPIQVGWTLEICTLKLTVTFFLANGALSGWECVLNGVTSVVTEPVARTSVACPPSFLWQGTFTDTSGFVPMLNGSVSITS